MNRLFSFYRLSPQNDALCSAVRSLIFAIFAIFLLSSVEAEEIRVATWNIQWFPGTRPNATEELVAKHIKDVQTAIADIRPDILLMQEIRNWNAAKLAVELNPELMVHVTSQFTGSQQLVIATRFAVNSGWAAMWKRTGKDDPPRGYAFAVIQLPGGQPAFFYSVHFKANSSRNQASNIAKREEATRQMLAHADAMEKLYSRGETYPVVFAGDFNTDPTDSRFDGEQTVHQIMSQGFRWIFDGMPLSKRITRPASGRFSDANFDHILYRGLDLVSVEVPDKFDHCSDHRPVVAVFRIGPSSHEK
jgi:endonuclease/exonuclease/phosphatase family metal-dependent hydrolase